MTDVRLTATNPDDSSVVPVACNSRGELLITDPVIEQINNDLVVTGQIQSMQPDDVRAPAGSFLGVKDGSGEIGEIYSHGGQQLSVVAGGYRTSADKWHSWALNGGSGGGSEIALHSSSGRIDFRCENNLATGANGTLTTRFNVTTSGAASSEFFIHPDGLTREDGRVIAVGAEIQFLRGVVQTLCEKMRVTPEGGWPVWDGSD